MMRYSGKVSYDTGIMAYFTDSTTSLVGFTAQSRSYCLVLKNNQMLGSFPDRSS